MPCCFECSRLVDNLDDVHDGDVAIQHDDITVILLSCKLCESTDITMIPLSWAAMRLCVFIWHALLYV